MKNIFCLFQRPFKIQKNGIFLFEISFFRFRDIDVFLLCKLETKISSFFSNQEPSTPYNLLMGVKTIWKLCLFQAAPFVSLQELIRFLDRKRLEPKELLWQHH